jgi:hypothetical protein
MDFLEVGYEGVDLIHVAQIKIQWRALAISIHVALNLGNILTG